MHHGTVLGDGGEKPVPKKKSHDRCIVNVAIPMLLSHVYLKPVAKLSIATGHGCANLQLS